MSYEEWADKAEVAQLYNVHQYDDNDDGIIDSTVLEFLKIKNGKLKPNTPYIIKPHAAETVDFVCTGKTLLATPTYEGFVDFSSTNDTYTFSGIYETKTDMYQPDLYTLSWGSFSQVASPSVTLSPYRFYLKVTSRSNSPSRKQIRVRMEIDGEELPIIEDLVTPLDDNNDCFDLWGRKKDASTRGLSVYKGVKFYIK